jgi:hypothetical protein
MFVLEGDILHFSLLRTLQFSLFSFNACSLFLVPHLAFIFCLDFYSDLVLSLHQGLVGPLVYVGIHQKSCFKKVRMVLEKRKSFMQKSCTKRSLFRMWFRLLHAMLDVILIVCLVIFAVAWLVSNDWDYLMSLLKKSCVVFSMWKHLFGFLLWCFIWVDLGHAYNMLDSYKVAISLYDHLVFDLWCHFMLLLMMFCRFAWLWPLLLS